MHVTSVFDERRSVPYTLPQLDRPKSTRLQVYTFTYTPTDACIVQSAFYFPHSMSDTLSLCKIQSRQKNGDGCLFLVFLTSSCVPNTC